MSVYYNEFDPAAAEWLRQLMIRGLIPLGDIDTRSIEDVTPADVAGYTQCHFFAGIGGWPLALAIAGVPATRTLWTGSCPCQPFSNAGKRKGHADERHLWPAFKWLIAQCGPAVVFGEQVSSPAGRAWLDTVLTDLEDIGYSGAAADLCAAGVGAPHIRQRLYWMALAGGERQQGVGLHVRERGSRPEVVEAGRSGEDNRGLGYTGSAGGGWNAGAVFDAKAGSLRGLTDVAILTSEDCGMADTDGAGSQGRGERGDGPDQCPAWAAGLDRPWDDVEWVGCRDPNGARWRPIEPGSQPLAHGFPERVGLLRGYGNAIVPQVAATFIKAGLNL